MSPKREQVKSSIDIDALSTDELGDLHDKILDELIERLVIEQGKLDACIAALHGHSARQRRRSYPEVAPKFQNPAEPSQTWSGRGRQPLWVTRALQAGKNLDDLLIAREVTLVPSSCFQAEALSKRVRMPQVHWPQDHIRRAALALREGLSNADIYVLARAALGAAVRDQSDLIALMPPPASRPEAAARLAA